MAECKGNLIYHLKNYIIEKYGDEGWKEILESTDDDVKIVLEETILSSNWYEKKVIEQLLEGIEKKYGKEEVIKSSVALADRQLRGLFGFIAQFFTIRIILNKMQWMWSKVWTEGKLELIEHKDGYVKVKTTEFSFTDIHRLHAEKYVNHLFEIATRKKYSSNSSPSGEDSYIFEFKPEKDFEE